MSKVTSEPFFFGSDEEDIQVKPEDFPAAIQEAEKNQETEKPVAKPNAEEKEEIIPSEDSVIEEEQDDSNPDSYNFFNKSDKKTKKEDDKKEKLTSDKLDYKALADFLVANALIC